VSLTAARAAVFGLWRAGRSSEAPPVRGFDVNRAPSAAASALAALEDDDDDPAAGALSSSPNDSGGSFPLDLRGRGRASHADGAAAAAGGERSSSRASDEDEGASARKKLRLSKEQSAFLEESFKEHSTLNPVRESILRTFLITVRILLPNSFVGGVDELCLSPAAACRSRRRRWRSSSISGRAKWRSGSRTAEPGACQKSPRY
jgi:hypothetical protein